MISDNKLLIKVLNAQKSELTESIIYKKLASIEKDKSNKEILERISQEECAHHDFWKKFTNKEVKPDKVKIFLYVLIVRMLGLTFGVKLMEKGEGMAQDSYNNLKSLSEEVQGVIEDEEKHEQELLNIINEEKLKYVGSIVLGLNDALVELTGALAGFTFALQNTRLIAAVGLVTGIAASLSMAASEYLSTKQEESDKNPIKASIYTGLAYVLTVLFLIFPYLVFGNVFLCLGVVLINALLVIAFFTFYVSVAKDVSFKGRFFEMSALSLSVALVSFFIGMVIRSIFGVDI